MATWIVAGALFVLVGMILWKMIRSAKAHKGVCGGDCSRCHGICGRT